MSDIENNLTQSEEPNNDNIQSINNNNESKCNYSIDSEIPDPTNEIKKLSEDFSNYFNFNQEHDEQLKEVSSSIELLVARTDELGTVVEGIQSNSLTKINELIPELIEKSQELKSLFWTVDQISVLINKIKLNLNELEKQMNSTYESTPKIYAQKFLGLFSKKKYTTEETPPFKPCEIVDTKKFFEEFRRLYENPSQDKGNIM